MEFSSLIFLTVFLPIVYICYLIIPNHKVRNLLLIIASLLFYAYGEPVYVFLMIASAALNYCLARIIEKTKNRKSVLIIAVVCNLGILGFFKYTGFLVDTLNSMGQMDIPRPEIALPIGISFFTFQAMSYVIDVYRGEVEAQKNFLKVLLYISFFPQLIAGPIVKYKDICTQIDHRSTSVSGSAEGFQRFVVGLAKKVLIANTMGLVADHIYGAEHGQLNAFLAWMVALTYALQIYYDFSGYSDMAIGLAKMFGFQIQENFMQPYTAVSVKDFWRKWHISLSSWFRDYVYIPLGGNRKGKARTHINKIIVFFLTGIWHGANWTFVLWGLWHGAFLLLEDSFQIFKKLPKFLGWIYTMLVVIVGFVMFNASTVSQGTYIIKEMFTGFSGEQITGFALQQLTPWFIFIFCVAILAIAFRRIATGYIHVHEEQWCTFAQKKAVSVEMIKALLCILLLLCCILRLSANTYNPFIYFRF